jgi:hypothetical protein
MNLGGDLMKSATKALVASIAAVLLGGCASGGGGGEDSGSTGTRVSVGQLLVCMMSPWACPAATRGTAAESDSPSECGTLYGQPVQCVPTQRAAIDAAMEDADNAGGSGRSSQSSAGIADQTPPPFVNWADPGRGVRTRADGLMTGVHFYLGSDSVNASVTEAPYQDSYGFVQYDRAGNLLYLAPGYPGQVPLFTGGERPIQNLAALGQPGIDVASNDNGIPLYPATNFASLPVRQLALIANPYVLGWDYQSFGVWDSSDSKTTGAIRATSFGAATPASAIPTVGNATFSGKLAGLYMSPGGQGSMASADLTVSANFASRTLGFASGGTTLTRDLKTATGAPNLDLSGTLTYAPGSNTFTGTLATAGGTMSGSSKGRFYGPAAQELGGVFRVKAATGGEAFTGAYGAKR